MVASCSIDKNVNWEIHITNFVKLYNELYKIQNIIDVGANFGYHSLLFSRIIDGDVYSFEPQEQNFQLLQNNVQQNNLNIHCGINEKNCYIIFFIFFGENVYLSSVDKCIYLRKKITEIHIDSF